MQLEISDLTDPLIHSIFGYGSQSLINLMLSGRAVSNVWDHDQDVGGLSKSSFNHLFKLFVQILTKIILSLQN
jgi:hypothetical protein